MIPIDEVAIRRALKRDNPWWFNPDWQPMETEHQRSYLEPFCDLALNRDIRRSTVLMGPRRVGKTVMLMQLIHRVLSSDEPEFTPNRIFFASLDTPLYGNMPLEQLIALFEEETECSPEEERLVVFDEIQYLKDWERHLKVLTDGYPNTKFICSGSAAAALRLKSDESGAGRFTDFLLPPLTFAEFLKFEGIMEILTLGGDLQESIDIMNTHFAQPNNINRLNKAFMDYLNFGGYPEAVLNPIIRENPERFIGRDIIDKVLLRDLPSLYGIRDPQELNNLLTHIAWNTGQELSLDKLSKASSVAKQTIARYLQYLEAAMLIRRIRRVDSRGKKFQREGQFKIYLTSPSLRAALFGPVSTDDVALGHVVETAVFAQYFQSALVDHLYYARWKSGSKTHEVDMVIVEPARNKTIFALECKWTDRMARHPEELSGLALFCKNNPELAESQTLATTKSYIGYKTQHGVTIECRPCALWCYRMGSLALDQRFNINSLKNSPLRPA